MPAPDEAVLGFLVNGFHGADTSGLSAEALITASKDWDGADLRTP